MPRHRSYHVTGMTPEKVKALYEKGKSLEGAARLAGVSRKTFWMWTKEAGLELRRGRVPTPPPPSHHHFSCLAKWIRENPDSRLPISPSRIASLTGCTIDAVKAYLKRRRGELRGEVTALPDLRGVKGVSLLTTEGYALPLIAIKAYEISIPRLRVRISGTLKSGRPFTIATDIDTLKGLVTSHTEG